ncbi:surfeit locus 1 family protein [Rhodoferax sp. TH121]|uniref:SURF1 family protein n=1 Tax=Rhodoferax sp. TH121 TaxID=2022803 RepID=UPI000B964A48|nr:SURF1 family protein [Rhodoferax sp. TH121]OYQ41465.1 surfeit locus 1 family protein [Rhodoferax sp. TH121]
MLATLAVLGLALLVGFSTLGVWQLQRRAWKLDLINRVTERIQAAPVAPPTAGQWPGLDVAKLEYLAVRLEGHWLSNKTVLTQASTVLGAGYWVLTPLQQTDGTQVLVNRGFVPASQRAEWLAPAEPDHKHLSVVGLLRKTEPDGGFLRSNDPSQQRWHSRDVAAIALAQQLPQAAPFFVDAGLPALLEASSAELAPNPVGPWPRPGLTVVRFSNSHLVYALTWFGLALMVVGAAVLVARYERRQHAAVHHPDHDTHD